MPLTAEEIRERHRESNRRWLAKNPNYYAEYYATHKEQSMKRVKEWMKNNPEKVMAHKQKYYASKNLYPRRPWDKWEDMLVLDPDITDKQLSPLIERSCSAIERRRSRLKKKAEMIAIEKTMNKEVYHG